MPAVAPPPQAALKRRRASLNARQRAYLLALYAEDQRAEQAHSGPPSGFHRPKARVWRWIEYGPSLGPPLIPDAPLRAALRVQGLVSQGSGSTWRALADASLVESKVVHVWIGAARIPVVFVQMTRAGRQRARTELGEARPKKDPAALSAGALRVLLGGAQASPGTFDPHRLWSCPPPYWVVDRIVRSLVKKGYLKEAPRERFEQRFAATPEGLAQAWKITGTATTTPSTSGAASAQGRRFRPC